MHFSFCIVAEIKSQEEEEVECKERTARRRLPCVTHRASIVGVTILVARPLFFRKRSIRT